jgi:spore coat polysaccharide biosynthesis protein SpsF (cytidylyltransferase family)
MNAVLQEEESGGKMETVTDSAKLKELFKQAIIEAMEEKRDLVHDLLVEAMEDLAMIRAIQEGEESAPASREEVFHILEGKE